MGCTRLTLRGNAESLLRGLRAAHRPRGQSTAYRDPALEMPARSIRNGTPDVEINKSHRYRKTSHVTWGMDFTDARCVWSSHYWSQNTVIRFLKKAIANILGNYTSPEIRNSFNRRVTTANVQIAFGTCLVRKMGSGGQTTSALLHAFRDWQLIALRKRGTCSRTNIGKS